MKKRIRTQIKMLRRDFPAHLGSFWIPWLLLGLMLLVAFVDMPFKPFVLLSLVAIFVLILVIKPMNIIYGLIGTHGYIGLFFFIFIVINFLFAGIYYETFFKHAGITYDINQPHVEFNIFEKGHNGPDTATLSPREVNLPHTCEDTLYFYYRTRFWWVLRNTFLTSLMQEPTDFFSAAGTYTGPEQNTNDLNYPTAFGFHWFLIFHIMISWILLGVFISLIYQRFRNS